MATKIRDVMTKDPVTMPVDSPIREVAQQMREHDIGSMILTDNGKLSSIVTDRDIVVRGIAEGKDGNSKISAVASENVASLQPDLDVELAINLMRNKSLRRVPVVEDGSTVVGIVSLGDLAVTEDPKSALGQISDAQPNA